MATTIEAEVRVKPRFIPEKEPPDLTGKVMVPNYTILGTLHHRNPKKDKAAFIGTKEKAEWCRQPNFTTRGDLLQARRHEKIPDKSFDIDGDGVVGGADYFIGKCFDEDKDGKLDAVEMEKCRQALDEGWLDKYEFGFERQGSQRPYLITQRRGGISILGNTEPHNPYPAHPVSSVIPVFNTVSDLKSHRNEEKKAIGNALNDGYNATRAFLLKEPKPPSKPDLCERDDEGRRLTTNLDYGTFLKSSSLPDTSLLASTSATLFRKERRERPLPEKPETITHPCRFPNVSARGLTKRLSPDAKEDRDANLLRATETWKTTRKEGFSLAKTVNETRTLQHRLLEIAKQDAENQEHWDVDGYAKTKALSGAIRATAEMEFRRPEVDQKTRTEMLEDRHAKKVAYELEHFSWPEKEVAGYSTFYNDLPWWLVKKMDPVTGKLPDPPEVTQSMPLLGVSNSLLELVDGPRVGGWYERKALNEQPPEFRPPAGKPSGNPQWELPEETFYPTVSCNAYAIELNQLGIPVKPPVFAKKRPSENLMAVAGFLPKDGNSTAQSSYKYTDVKPVESTLGMKKDPSLAAVALEAGGGALWKTSGFRDLERKVKMKTAAQLDQEAKDTEKTVERRASLLGVKDIATNARRFSSSMGLGGWKVSDWGTTHSATRRGWEKAMKRVMSGQLEAANVTRTSGLHMAAAMDMPSATAGTSTIETTTGRRGSASVASGLLLATSQNLASQKSRLQGDTPSDLMSKNGSVPSIRVSPPKAPVRSQRETPNIRLQPPPSPGSRNSSPLPVVRKGQEPPLLLQQTLQHGGGASSPTPGPSKSRQTRAASRGDSATCAAGATAAASRTVTSSPSSSSSPPPPSSSPPRNSSAAVRTGGFQIMKMQEVEAKEKGKKQRHSSSPSRLSPHQRGSGGGVPSGPSPVRKK